MSDESAESFTLYGLDPEKPGHFLVTAHNGDDKIGLWSFDAEKKQFDELIYRRSDVDVQSLRNALLHEYLPYTDDRTATHRDAG